MPKFLIKHGCCYIPPVESESSTTTTCQVFANPHFDYRVSDALCRVGKSSPEFANQSNHNRKQISWGYLDDIVPPHCSRSPAENSDETDEEVHHTREHTPSKRPHENYPENHEENLSLFTIYGNRAQHGAYDSDKNICDRPISDASIYRPTTTTSTKKPENDNISTSEKFLDCVSMCLWRCSSWCQKID